MSSKVYFVPLTDGSSVDEQVKAMQRIYETANVSAIIDEKNLVAVKLSVGEKHNITHIKPPLVKEVIDQIKRKGAYPFLAETSTLYKGERENAVKHTLHAEAHGFGIKELGAPFIMVDGLLGNSEIDVEIAGVLHDKVKIAREAVMCDAIIALSHPTGHGATGLGACLKNLGMGLASRMGKMRQHSALKPAVIPDKCKLCGKCIQWCPEGVITEKDGKAFINDERCIGCGECLAVCNFGSVKYDWDANPTYLQQSMAEHAYGSVKSKLEKKSFYINVLVDMTKDCDCASKRQEKMIPDVGILASADPVAVDMATLDLTAKANGKHLTAMAYPEHDPMIQLRHAARIGMGSLEYELITL